MPKRLAIQRALLEFVVIVVGVLTGLAADDWRAHRADDAREGEILVDLLEEFQQDRDILVSDLDWNRQRLEAGINWVELADATDRPGRDSVFTAWEQLRPPYIFQPVTGVIQSVIDAGELSLIENRRLRARIAGWPGLAGELSEIHRLNVAFVTDVILPLDVRRGATNDPATSLAALDDAVLTNVYRRFNRSMTFAVARGDALMKDLDEIIEDLETELASR